MTKIESSYPNPETRPFGGFLNDMTKEQHVLRRKTMTMLSLHKYNTFNTNQLTYRLSNIIQYGGVFQETKKECTGWLNGCYFARFDNSSKHQLEGGLGVWYDGEKRLFCVLEWNKVRGLVVRSYSPMTFLKKLYKHYTFCAYESQQDAQLAITPETYQSIIDEVFVDYTKMKVEVWDKPSKMYEHTNIDSCMVGEDYVKFYDTAPVKGLVVTFNGKLVARCLLWTTDSGKRIIGRIYDSTANGKKLIHKWCEENGVLTDWGDSHTVTAPISKYGVPYQDNLYYGCRVGDNLVMFNDSDVVIEFKNTNKGVYNKKIHDLQCQTGNSYELRCDMVLCVDGSYVPTTEAITYNGEFHNPAKYKRLAMYNIYKIPQDQLVLHPNRMNVLLPAREFSIVNGYVVITAECITLEDGQVVHPSQCSELVELVDGKLVITKKVYRDKQGNYTMIADQYIKSYVVGTHNVPLENFMSALMTDEVNNYLKRYLSKNRVGW